MKYILPFLLFFGLSIYANDASSNTLSGHFSYKPIFHLPNGDLDYKRTNDDYNFDSVPLRYFTVLLLDAKKKKVIACTKTDDQGFYSFIIHDSKVYQVKILAEINKKRASCDNQLSEYSMLYNVTWNFSVYDSQNTIYSESSKYLSIDEAKPMTYNSVITSGWEQSEYNFKRRAAPFVILNTILEAMYFWADELPDLMNYPALKIHWSPTLIKQTRYDAKNNKLFIAGHIDNTDEYDPHVILEAWNHYFYHHFFRSNSNETGLNGFMEGWNKALATYMLKSQLFESTVFYDSKRSNSLSLDLTSLVNKSETEHPWNERDIIAQLLYKLFDSEENPIEGINIKFENIYWVMNGTFKASKKDSTLFLFTDLLTMNYDIEEGLQQLFKTHKIEPMNEMRIDAINTSDKLNLGETKKRNLNKRTYVEYTFVAPETKEYTFKIRYFQSDFLSMFTVIPKDDKERIIENKTEYDYKYGNYDDTYIKVTLIKGKAYTIKISTKYGYDDLFDYELSVY
jgi:hypothetical protein